MKAVSLKDYGLDIAKTIKARRAELGLSLQDVADATGLSKAHIWDMERGASSDPRLTTLLAVSDALRMSLAQILGAEMSQPLLSQQELELIQYHRRLFRVEETSDIEGRITRSYADEGDWSVPMRCVDRLLPGQTCGICGAAHDGATPPPK
jgi:transcriptional regulator with XRE-family HTH domain